MKRFLNKIFGRSDIYFQSDLYMRRWRLGFRWSPGVRLHHIVRSDKDRELHDHPFSFISIILRGGYTEYLIDGSKKFHGPGSILIRQAETLHRLELERPAWTLVIRGPIRRTWGFLTANGWVRWQDFTAEHGNAEVIPLHQPYRAPSSI